MLINVISISICQTNDRFREKGDHDHFQTNVFESLAKIFRGVHKSIFLNRKFYF